MDRRSIRLLLGALAACGLSNIPSAFAENRSMEAGLIRLWASPHTDSANIQTIRNGDNISPPALHKFMAAHRQDNLLAREKVSSEIESSINFALKNTTDIRPYNRTSCNRYLCEIVVVFNLLPEKGKIDQDILDQISRTLSKSDIRQYRQFSIGKGPGPNGDSGISIFAYISI